MLLSKCFRIVLSKYSTTIDVKATRLELFIAVTKSFLGHGFFLIDSKCWRSGRLRRIPNVRMDVTLF